MITVKDVIFLTNRHKNCLAMAGQSAEAVKRWAFLVTTNEISALVDEMQTNSDFGMAMEPAQATHIKEGRAMLHINEVPILPELMEVPTTLDS